MPRPSAAASRAGVQMQGFHPTVCGLPSAREWPKGHYSGLRLNNEADTDHRGQPGGPQSQDLQRVSR